MIQFIQYADRHWGSSVGGDVPRLTCWEEVWPELISIPQQALRCRHVVYHHLIRKGEGQAKETDRRKMAGWMGTTARLATLC
jgi:hypothetical protein